MTAADFRRIALSLDGAEEKAHGGHPDFRVNGKIFATLGYPDNRFGTLVLSPEDQSLLVRSHPKAFTPAAGAWGRKGSTSVLLRFAPRRVMEVALEAAWERRVRPKRSRKVAGASAGKRSRSSRS